MAEVFPFRAVRPQADKAAQVSAPPYDVMNREEAAQMSEGLPHSFLHVSRPEIEFPASMDSHSPEIYWRARANFDRMVRDGVLFQDKAECLYVYRQRMGEHEQYGLVCCMLAKDYFENRIKKHELTRADKEEDRLQHVLYTNAHSGPVFLAYRDKGQFGVYGKVTSRKPDYDFVSADGIGHTVWTISAPSEIAEIRSAFAEVPCTYIADGHHRSAAGARAAKVRAEGNPANSGNEEYNRYLTILFPSSQLHIFDYNRLLKDMNGRSVESLLADLGKVFEIKPLAGLEKPANPRQVNLYLQKKWYACTFRSELVDENDPVKSLDVSLLQENVLKPIFAIDDPRTSKRIDFVGGIRGLGELVKRVDSGECACAFAMYPTSLDQLMAIADAGEIMPPKSTWFEPKLRDGLLIHLLD